MMVTKADAFVRNSLRPGDIVRKNTTHTQGDDPTPRKWEHKINNFGRDLELGNPHMIYTVYDDGVERYGSWMSIGNMASVLDLPETTVERDGVIVWANGAEVTR